MKSHTKVAQFSIRPVHFSAFVCPLSLLLLAAVNLRAGACHVLPKGGRGLSFALIRDLGMGLGLAEGYAGASTSLGAASGAALGWD